MAKIYIAGKMTGLECYGFESFFYWARIWRRRGYKVINPAQIDCEKMLEGWAYTPDQYEEILAYDLNLIKTEADAIFMMNNWNSSKGATEEYRAALEKDIDIFYQEDEVTMESDARRYRKLVSLSPRQYKALYKAWMQSGGKSFDSCLDSFDVTDKYEPLKEIWGDPLQTDPDKF